MSFKKRTIEKIASYIPGYAGYKAKEVRRETDARLRRHIASILSSAAAQLVLSPTDARAIAANPDARFLWDSVKAALDKVTQKIDKAPHGYSGFFDLVKVDEAVLEQVYSHDLTLVEAAKKVADAVASLKALKPGTAEWVDALRQILAALQSLDAAVDERNKILKGIAEAPPPMWEVDERNKILKGIAEVPPPMWERPAGEEKKRDLLDRLFKRG